MGVMVQDLQAKGLSPPPKKKQVLPGASSSSAGRTACLLPLLRPGPGLTAHSWIHFHSAASGFLNRTLMPSLPA